MVSKNYESFYRQDHKTINTTDWMYKITLRVILVGLVLSCILITGCVSSDTDTQTTNQVQPVISRSDFTPESCVKSLYGVCFGPYMDRQDPTKNGSIDESQIRSRLSGVGSSMKWIRTYGCTAGLEKTGSIAHEMGLKIATGAWLSTNTTANEKEIQSLINLGKSGDADVLVVGNEALLRGDLTEEQVITYIRQVKSAVPNIPVTTVEPYAVWQSHPNLIDEVDSVYINLYPFWDGVEISKATIYAKEKYLEIQKIAKGKSVVISETGFPSSGTPVGLAVPSLDNADRYFREIASWSENENIPMFYFELYDEKWKAITGPEVEAHWGILNADGSRKLSFCPTQSSTTTVECKNPSIEITKYPETGEISPSISGIIRCADPDKDAIVVYIKVNQQWYGPKPYWNQPYTSFRKSGDWTCSVVTGGDDQSAESFAAYLLPRDVTPPNLEGTTSLPKELDLYPHDQKSRNVRPTPTPTPTCSTPSIKITDGWSSGSSVDGTIKCVDPDKNKVTVYIKVSGQYWGPKPYWSIPLTSIDSDGSWSCTYVTGGNDQDASEIVAYLIPNGYTPPSVSGSTSLPNELDKYPQSKSVK